MKDEMKLAMNTVDFQKGLMELMKGEKNTDEEDSDAI